MLKEGACLVANTGYIGPFQAIQLYVFGNGSVKGSYTGPSITNALEHDKLEMVENSNELKCLRLVYLYHGKIHSDKSGWIKFVVIYSGKPRPASTAPHGQEFFCANRPGSSKS